MKMFMLQIQSAPSLGTLKKNRRIDTVKLVTL